MDLSAVKNSATGCANATQQKLKVEERVKKTVKKLKGQQKKVEARIKAKAVEIKKLNTTEGPNKERRKHMASIEATAKVAKAGKVACNSSDASAKQNRDAKIVEF